MFVLSLRVKSHVGLVICLVHEHRAPTDLTTASRSFGTVGTVCDTVTVVISRAADELFEESSRAQGAVQYQRSNQFPQEQIGVFCQVVFRLRGIKLPNAPKPKD